MRKGFADVTHADNNENIGSIKAKKIQINKSPSMRPPGKLLIVLNSNPGLGNRQRFVLISS